MTRWPVAVALAVLVCLETASAPGAPAPKKKAKPKPEASSDAWPEPEAIDPHGRPEGQIHAQAARFYVFRVKDQWHVITTSLSPSLLKFKGTISVDRGAIKAAVPIGKEKPDDLQLSPSRKEITFTLRTAKKADGFYFVVSPEVRQIKFDLDPPGTKRPRSQIFVGQGQVNPRRSPFVLRVGE